jgi:purine-binding chemotaxis protein CheW
MEHASSNPTSPVLILRSGPHRCALPLSHVVETMRPLPVQPLSNMPSFVSGAAIVRGEAVPVVDLGILLGIDNAVMGRFVVIRVEESRVALAVDGVIGIEDLDAACLTSVPPLLKNAHPDLLSALGHADQKLLLVLNTARILPDEVWASLRRSQEVSD